MTVGVLADEPVLVLLVEFDFLGEQPPLRFAHRPVPFRASPRRRWCVRRLRERVSLSHIRVHENTMSPGHQVTIAQQPVDHVLRHVGRLVDGVTGVLVAIACNRNWSSVIDPTPISDHGHGGTPHPRPGAAISCPHHGPGSQNFFHQGVRPPRPTMSTPVISETS